MEVGCTFSRKVAGEKVTSFLQMLTKKHLTF